jgi:hypothetical protein
VASVTVTNIHTITAQIISTKNTVGRILAMAYIEIGGLLTKAKELVPPGEWTYYLENEVNFSHRTANNCMKLYAEYSKNPDSQALANMPYAKAVRFLALPEDEREEFLETHDVENMSSREFDKAIKEARAATKAAEDRGNDLAEKLKLAQADNASNQDVIKQLTDARDRAVADAEAARKRVEDLEKNPKVPKSLISNLASEASRQAAAAYQSRIDEAVAAKEAAEKVAQEAQQKLSVAQNFARVSSPEAAAFSVLYPQIETSFNQLKGCYLKVAGADPELGEKLKDLMRQLVDRFQKSIG